jgi:DMSO reductase family type II enzyme heme b subunit
VKPHFFLGHVGKPVNLWHWKADTQSAMELNATGYKNPAKEQPPESQSLTAQSIFEDGQWRVVMKRPLTTEDDNDLQFATGSMIPIAFHVWDGYSGETGLRRTISSWYFVVLEAKVPPTVYVNTVAAIVVTAGAQFLLIRRVRRKEG